MRYVWDLYDEYYRNASLPGRLAMRLFRDRLRRYDLESAECVDRFIANSRFVAERIRRIYGRDAEVVHPPADIGFFGVAPEMERGYFLLAGQLTAYKRPELAVRAFSRLDDRLIVAGSGEELPRLRAIAGKNVEFVVAPDDETLRKLYAGARALVFPGIEDFGIVPVEAQAAGCPVIAFRAGGALESVVEGRTGLFFDEQSEASLLGARLRSSRGAVSCRRSCEETRRAFRVRSSAIKSPASWRRR